MIRSIFQRSGHRFASRKRTKNKVRVPASAADLKFLHRLQVRNGNFKSKSCAGIKYLSVPLLFPKFV
jgi:aminoglycoside phosphotransferase